MVVAALTVSAGELELGSDDVVIIMKALQWSC